MSKQGLQIKSLRTSDLIPPCCLQIALNINHLDKRISHLQHLSERIDSIASCLRISLSLIQFGSLYPDLHPTQQHLCTFSLVIIGNGDHLATTLGITDLYGTSLSLLIRYSAFTPCSCIKALKIINHSLLTLH